MEEWKQYRLGDIISISSGLAYKGGAILVKVILFY